jgi:hypothetical protein
VRSVTTDGGTVTARCVGAVATLVSWSPRTEWGVGGVVAGPASTVRVRFVHESDRIDVSAVCRAGAPVFSSSEGDDESGDD